MIVGIHIEDTNGGSTDRRLAKHMNAALLEMFCPKISSRMKQFRDRISLRINAGQVWAFVQVTIDASQCQIFNFITATVKFGNDSSMCKAANGESF